MPRPRRARQAPAEPDRWVHAGPVRIRDLTPFGILRLDFLPAHAVSATPGTWAFEVNLSYQNTYAVSDDVAAYLWARNGGRRAAWPRSTSAWRRLRLGLTRIAGAPSAVTIVEPALLTDPPFLVMAVLIQFAPVAGFLSATLQFRSAARRASPPESTHRGAV